MGVPQNPIDWRLVRRDSDESCTEDSEDDADEEFFDCQGNKRLYPPKLYFYLYLLLILGEMAVEATSLAKWSSLELLMEEDLDGSPLTGGSNGIYFFIWIIIKFSISVH